MQLLQVSAAQVPHLDPLEVLPHALVRVQVWRVGRQPLQVNGGRAAICQVALNGRAPMDRRAVPDDQQPVGHITPQVPQEEDALGPGQRVAPNERRQLPRGCDPAHRRQMVTCLEDPQDRRLTNGRVSADYAGQQVKARLVHQDDGAPFAPGFFFSAGHRSARHAAIAASSRWAARSPGFCGVHANVLSRRETCARWYETENCRRMSSVIRAHVQTAPRKPYASAPCASSSGIKERWSSVSLAAAPVWGRAANASSPRSRTKRIHLLTAAGVTARASAISCCFQPRCLSASARQRRSSFQSGEHVASAVMQAFLSCSKKLTYQCNSH